MGQHLAHILCQKADELILYGRQMDLLTIVVHTARSIVDAQLAIDKDRCITIISEQKEKGQLDPALVETMITYYDAIMAETAERCQPILDIYQQLHAEYQQLYRYFA